MSFTVVIPSRNPANLIPCLTALRKHEPTCPIVIIDDGLGQQCLDQAAFCDPIAVIPGRKPFCFATNCNLGIRDAMEAGHDGVVLLNDDALLESPLGFTALDDIAQRYAEVGIMGAVTNLTGQPLQRPQQSHKWRPGQFASPDIRATRTVPHIAFVCVYIPRRTIELVGILDERYTKYGCDDADYCEAVTRAGLKVAVHDGCFVDHASLHSSYRGEPETAGDFSHNYKLLLEKWGKLVTQP